MYCKQNNLFLLKCPTIVGQWNEFLNKGIDIATITVGSHKNIWWTCDKDHTWLATIKDRYYKGNGCPYCSGQKVATTNCLASKFTEITKEWNHDKNGDLTPYNVTPKSNKSKWLGQIY